MVLAYLQKHPGTPDEKLPGSLVWFNESSSSSRAVWDAAKNSGVTSLMHREEVEQYEDTYNQLKRIDDTRSLAYDAMNDATRYELTDNRLSHLSPAQIGEITTLTQIGLTKHWLEGVALENTARKFKDFPPRLPQTNSLRLYPLPFDEARTLNSRKVALSASSVEIAETPFRRNRATSPPQRFRHAIDNTAMLFQAKCRLLEVPPLPASTKGCGCMISRFSRQRECRSAAAPLDDVMPALDF
jgi:hypothetical protein